jgi:hypothetical protein
MDTTALTTTTIGTSSPIPAAEATQAPFPFPPTEVLEAPRSPRCHREPCRIKRREEDNTMSSHRLACPLTPRRTASVSTGRGRCANRLGRSVTIV